MAIPESYSVIVSVIYLIMITDQPETAWLGLYRLLVCYLHRLPGFHQRPCRIVVYSPQIYENYILQSGEGLSVLFVVVWLLGDLTNFVGAILANLLPTVIFLGVYVSHSIGMRLFS